MGSTWQKVISAVKESNNKLPLVGKTTNYGDTKFIYRQDNDFSSKTNRKGALKSYIDDKGNLLPANPNGSASIQSHVRGGNSKDSPFISFTDPSHSNGVKSYGREKISVNLKKIGDDIKAGKLPNTQIISHNELKSSLQKSVNEAKIRYESNPTPKNRARLERSVNDLNNVKRDGECLIKGCIPSEYIFRSK